MGRRARSLAITAITTSVGGNDGNDQGDDNGQGDDEGQMQACTSANLITGASVRGAELKISSAGAVWDKVGLIS